MSDSRALRDCLGQYATGVTVVTCRDAHQTPCGITANSFSSVSLDPPKILWNVARTSHSLAAYLKAAYFGVNVLADGQRAVAEKFAQSRHDLYDDTAHRLSPHGVPLLGGCLAWIECRTAEIHECGDHYIIIGDVIDFRREDGRPLLFYAGDYRSLGASR